MLSKKFFGAALACALALGGWSGAALANPISVDGITWNPARTNDLTIDANNFRESAVTAVGQTLTGYGEIASINGQDFCGVGNTNCDLTFQFSYTVSNITDNGDGTTNVVFDDGTIDFYVQAQGSFDVLNPATLDTSNLWLSTTGHTTTWSGFNDGSGNPIPGQLFATVNGPAGNPGSKSGGNGLLDVVPTGPGTAAWWMNTNGQTDGADLALTSSFQLKVSSGCGTAPSTDPTSICFYPISGTGSVIGKTAAVSVPEPGELGLLGLGLVALGFLIRRRRKTSDERA